MESASITFDRVINTLSGTISGIKMISNESFVAYGAQVRSDSVNNIDINKLHEMMGIMDSLFEEDCNHACFEVER
jgi:hypothetical protein